MRNFVCIALIGTFLFAACDLLADSTASPQSDSAPAILISKCDRKCQKMMSAKYPFERSASIMGKDKPVSYVILSILDGVRGKNSTNFDPAGAYNSSWNGKFEISTSPGKKSMLIYPTSLVAAPDEGLTVEFDAQPGQTYLVASLFRRVNRGGIQINNWTPLVMNVNSNEVLIPEGEPEWREFCFAAQEFGAALPCPDGED